ncbi:MAG: hypothetical protein N2115_02690 [bacterium]|nr:hypothetical protein [bacterium]
MRKTCIVISYNISISSSAIRVLKTYLESVSGNFVDVIFSEKELPKDCNLIIIGNPERNKRMGKFCGAKSLRNLREDGYLLRTLSEKNRYIVLICGKTEKGDKYAIYHLMREIKVSGKKIAFPHLDIRINPFIKTREVVMGDACPWDPFFYENQINVDERAETYDTIFNSEACYLNCPDRFRKKYAMKKIVEKYCIENWEKVTLLDYINQMDSFGFNSIQFYDEAESYMHSGCLVNRRQLREKIISMMDQTRKIGNRISFTIWGAYAWVQNNIRVVSDWDDPLCDEKVVFSPDFQIKDSKCWNSAEGRKKIQAHLNYFTGYIKLVDHIISHFYDPGGCNQNGCTIGTCVRIMNYQTRKFRRVNPDLQASFNLWPLTSNHEGFSKDEVYSNLTRTWSKTFTWWNFTKVVDLLDPDIMIANRCFDYEIAEMCSKWKRKYGLWTWYTSDQEITASLHVEAERLGREFGQLPEEAGSILEYVCVPSNCHGLNSASIYIASRLLWEPKRNPFEILKEFCNCVFGPKISDAIYSGYYAIARIRNRDIKGDSAFNDAYLGAGTPDVEKDIELSGDALYKLNKISIDSCWIPKIPIVIDREIMLEDLREHVKMIHQYARFRQAYLKLSRKARITDSDWKKLPAVEKFKNTGGMIEWRKWRDILNLSPMK